MSDHAHPWIAVRADRGRGDWRRPGEIGDEPEVAASSRPRSTWWVLARRRQAFTFDGAGDFLRSPAEKRGTGDWFVKPTVFY